jgi:G:T-mismatch repair DNA endonuclease (very short patch repair protein)
MSQLLDRISPGEWKYTGDGGLVIGGRNPDFANVNGMNTVIEVFGDYWHGPKRTGKTNEEVVRERVDHFAQYGFRCLVIWERELRFPNEVETKLKGELCD